MNEQLRTINDPKQEHIFGRDHVALIDHSGEGWLHVTGKDCKSYLHRMTSNDIERLKDGQGQHGLYLTAQGKILSELHVYQDGPESLYLQIPGLSTEMVAKRFTLFIINNDVTIEDQREARVLLSIQGPKANTVLESLGGDLGTNSLDHKKWTLDGVECHILRRSRLGTQGFDLVVPRDQSQLVIETLKKAVEEHGGGVIGAEAAESVRLAAAVPAFGKEINEEVLPQEAYLEQTAISFDKGCYPGQETVAKIKYRGRVNRHLVRFEIDGETTPTNRPQVNKNGKKVGVLTSAIKLPEDSKIVGMGYVKTDLVEGAEVEIAFEDQVIKARVAPLPKVKQ
jgi:tRNA-modifying protein YgfZ